MIDLWDYGVEHMFAIPWSVGRNGFNDFKTESSDGDKILSALCQATTLARFAQEIERPGLEDISKALELGRFKSSVADRHKDLSKKWELIRLQLVKSSYIKPSQIPITRHALVLSAVTQLLSANPWTRSNLSWSALQSFGTYGYQVCA